jgi:hypothetical protein
MIEIAKNAASDCQVIWEFAKIIAEHCTDQKYVVKNKLFYFPQKLYKYSMFLLFWSQN